MDEDNKTIDTTAMKMPEGIRHSHLGPILGILLLFLVLVAVGLFLWGGMLMQSDPAEPPRVIENNEPETPRAVADMKILGTVSSSNEIDAIAADVLSTNLDSLDSDIGAAEQELNAALDSE